MEGVIIRSLYMSTKKLSYRQAKKGIAEQYGINLSKKMLNEMNISPVNREVEVKFNDKLKAIIITKKT